MAAIKIPTAFNIDVEFETPDFFRRLVSLLLDMIVQYCYIRVILEVIELLPSDIANIAGILLVLPLFVYHIALEVTMNGQSIGKKIMGIRVVYENGGRAGISQFLIRWLLRVSDIWIVLLVFVLLNSRSEEFSNTETLFIILGALAFLVTDILLVIASRKNQRIGDILARTILIRTGRKASIKETVFQELADDYTPSFPQIMRLSDRDINAIKSILETARKTGDFEMAATAGNKIKTHLKIESSHSPFEFLEILLKDYNYLSIK